MTPAARLAAAIEVFAAIENERRPAADALKAWGLTHRFAGSGDRAAIAGLVYDAVAPPGVERFRDGRRHTAGHSSWACSGASVSLDTEAIARLADGSQYAPEVLSRRRARTS